MINQVNLVSNQTNNSFSYFKSSNQVKKGYRTYRYHNVDDPTTGDKVRAITGSVIGTAVPLVYFARKQNGQINSLKKLFNIKYGLPEMTGIAAGSITGGVLFGMMGESAQKRKKKFNEGVFQFMNAVLPPVVVAAYLAVTKNNKFLNKPCNKLIGMIGSLAAGMFFGAKASNIITDPKDLYPDRRLNMKDAIANMDDVVGGLILAKFPLIDKLHIEKTIPFIYGWCGYRAGQNS